MEKKRVLITGINGMDGSHLADFLLDKNYEIFGIERRSSVKNRTNTSHLEGKINFINGDLTDQNSLLRCLKISEPHEVYNLAAQSFVGESWNTPEQTSDVTGLGALRMLEAIREFDPKNSIKFYQASSSEMFGRMVENPANENTPFYPRSPYGVAKLYAHWITVNYRESYGIFAASGILFNHESPLRGLEFVTRKITDGIAKIKLGKLDCLQVGNLDAKRDWGYAKDYVEGMWKMLQIDKPDTFVLATNKTYTVRDFLILALQSAGMSALFKGKGSDEILVNDNGKTILKINPDFYRPAEVDLLIGDATKAKNQLNWAPTTTLETLCKYMIKADLRRNKD